MSDSNPPANDEPAPQTVASPDPDEPAPATPRVGRLPAGTLMSPAVSPAPDEAERAGTLMSEAAAHTPEPEPQPEPEAAPPQDDSQPASEPATPAVAPDAEPAPAARIGAQTLMSTPIVPLPKEAPAAPRGPISVKVEEVPPEPEIEEEPATIPMSSSTLILVVGAIVAIAVGAIAAVLVWVV